MASVTKYIKVVKEEVYRDEINMYLYQRYLNNITLENIKKAIMNLSLLSGLKEMWGNDEELQDSARKKLDEMDPKTADEKYIKYSPDTIHGKIHKLLEDDIKENNNVQFV